MRKKILFDPKEIVILYEILHREMLEYQSTAVCYTKMVKPIYNKVYEVRSGLPNRVYKMATTHRHVPGRKAGVRTKVHSR